MERENRYNTIIKITTIVIVTAVVGVLIFGSNWEFLIKPVQTIVTVNGDEISTRQYQKQVRFERQRLVNYYEQYFQMYYYTVQSGGDPSNSMYTTQLKMLEYQLEPAYTGQSVMQRLVENTVIQQEAEKLGIEVSDEEVQELIQSLFSYFPNGEPTATVSPTTAPTSTLSATQLALATMKPSATPSPSPTGVSPTPTIYQIVPTATAAPYTYDDFQADYQEILDGYKSSIDFTEADYTQLVLGEIYRMKVSEFITKDLPHEQEQVWARHILVEDEDTANEVYDKLKAGEDFSQLAAEYSTDPSNAEVGGDLGWFSKTDMVAEFSDAAFNLDIGEISPPVQTDYGWHIIQVLGHENRPLNPSEYATYQDQEFSNWLDEKVNEADVVYRDNWVARAPEKPAIPATMKLQ